MAYTAPDNLPPVHPGEILRDELAALGMSARKFASHIGVPANAITAILNGKRGVSAAMALRLGKAFGTGERYWINLQSYYETKVAKAELAGKIDAIVPLTAS
jgi:addiction module HigA family antidote